MGEEGFKVHQSKSKPKPSMDFEEIFNELRSIKSRLHNRHLDNSEELEIHRIITEGLLPLSVQTELIEAHNNIICQRILNELYEIFKKLKCRNYNEKIGLTILNISRNNPITYLCLSRELNKKLLFSI